MLTEIRKRVSPKQEQFLFSEAKYLAYVGGVGAGKTNAGAKKAMRRSLECQCNGMIAAPTYRMLKDSTLPTFQEEAEGFIAEYHKADMVITMINGSTIYLRSAEDPDKIRGLNLNWFWLDEAAFMDRYIWPVAIGRLRQVIKRFSPLAFITCTPKGRNWIYEVWCEQHKNQDGYELIRVSIEDNPFLPQEYIENLKLNYFGKYYAQEIMGEFVTFEGLVYDMFNPDIHVILPKDQPKYERYEYGLDYGYTNPTGIAVFGIPKAEEGRRPYDVQVYETYKRQMTQDAVVDQMLALYQQYGIGRVWVDPSEPDLITVLQQNGIKAQAADNDVTTGIQREQAALELIAGFPGTYILSTCVHTIAEMLSYCWASKGKGTDLRYQDKPEKVNDHLMDARRYYRMSTITGRRKALPGLLSVGVE